VSFLLWVINMLPQLTSDFLVVLKTDCNGANSAIGEIGVIKCLDDFFKYDKKGTSIVAVEEGLEWLNPEFIEDLVMDHLFDEQGEPTMAVSEDEYWQAKTDPHNVCLGYEIEIYESVEGILSSNREVLQDIATNYAVESWEVVRNLPGYMVLSVRGAKVK